MRIQVPLKKIQKKKVRHVDLGSLLKYLMSVSDKMSRGIAKKAFIGSKRLNMSYSDIAKAVTDALTKTNKMVEGMDKAIDEISNYVDKEKILDSSTSSTESTSDATPAADNIETKEASPVEEALFDIKSLNDIDDRVIRGTLKKVYMAGKRVSKGSKGVIDDMKSQLDADGKLTDELIGFLEGLSPSESSTESTSDATPAADNIETKEASPVEEALFDIKSLNDIDDRVIRGTLKKVYMAGKRVSKGSKGVIDDMKSQLDADGKLTDELIGFLEGILNG